MLGGAGGDIIPPGLTEVSGSQKCAVLIRNQPHHAETRSPKPGWGELAVIDSAFSCPAARIKLFFMASSVCLSGSQPRQETI